MDNDTKIYAIGETILDLIFENNNPIAAKAGGSMLNTAVSLGRLGLSVEFISEYGCDKPGELIDNFLSECGVSTNYLKKFTDGKTPLALAFLDKNKNASYTFYKDYPPERLEIEMPLIKQNDIVLFGSSFSINPDVRRKLTELLKNAKENSATIIYDPNYRKGKKQKLQEHLPFIIENMKYASVVRGSNEDFKHIFNTDDAVSTYNILNEYCDKLIYTHSNEKVWVLSKNQQASYTPQKIVPISTIGAGDNFNAGLIYSLHALDCNFDALSKSNLDFVINNCIKFASEVCMSLENYISEGFAKQYFKRSDR